MANTGSIHGILYGQSPSPTRSYHWAQSQAEALSIAIGGPPNKNKFNFRYTACLLEGAEGGPHLALLRVFSWLSAQGALLEVLRPYVVQDIDLGTQGFTVCVSDLHVLD